MIHHLYPRSFYNSCLHSQFLSNCFKFIVFPSERALTPNFPVCVPGTIFIMYPVILAKPSVLSFPINLSSCQFCLCKFTIICFHFHTSRHHLSYLIIYTANSPFSNPFKALFLSCNKTSTLLLYSNTLNGN